MTEIYGLATLWLGLALVATLLSIWLRIATAMSEIIVGTMVRKGATRAWHGELSAVGAVQQPCVVCLVCANP